MKKILVILFFFSPFPLFIDGENLCFFIYFPPIGDLDAMQNTKPKIPLPVVLFSIAVLISSGILKIFDIKIVCKTCWSLAIFILLPLFMTFMIMGVSFLTFVQVFMGLLLVASISTISNRQYLDKCAKYYLWGIFTWLFFHALSMLSNNNFSLIGIERNWNFSTFFGMYIYQSQVSYAATLSIFLIFSIFMYLEKHNTLVALVTFILSGFIGFVSDTRLFVWDFLLIMTLLVSFYSTDRKIFSISVRKAIVIAWGGAVLLFGITYYANRFITKGSSDRFELINKALNEIISNPDLIFWGAGSKHSYAHNFFIDFILNYGVLSLFLVIFIIIYSLNKIKKILDLSSNGLVYCSMLIVITITNSSFNSAITQPLFICNIILVLTIVISYMRRYPNY